MFGCYTYKIIITFPWGNELNKINFVGTIRRSWETFEAVCPNFSSSMTHFHQSFLLWHRVWRWSIPYPYMVIPSINRFHVPLLGSYYRILSSMDFDSQSGSCYWYIQGNYWQGWCNDKMTYMAWETYPYCYIGWSSSVASHRHSSQHVENTCRHWILPSATGAEELFTVNMVS